MEAQYLPTPHQYRQKGGDTARLFIVVVVIVQVIIEHGVNIGVEDGPFIIIQPRGIHKLMALGMELL